MPPIVEARVIPDCNYHPSPRAGCRVSRLRHEAPCHPSAVRARGRTLPHSTRRTIPASNSPTSSAASPPLPIAPAQRVGRKNTLPRCGAGDACHGTLEIVPWAAERLVGREVGGGRCMFAGVEVQCVWLLWNGPTVYFDGAREWI